MKNYSSEQVARMISAGFMVLGLFGYNTQVSADQVSSAVEAIVVNSVLLVSLGMDIVGYVRRYFKGDVTLGGRRIP